MDFPQFAGRPNRPDEIERQLDTRTRDEYTVTAIVSAYASTKFLPGLLEDLFGQTLYARGELEIVFVDSHSPEDDWSLIEAAAGEHEHVRAIRTVSRETLYTAWNRAIAEARGRYISNANTDDRHRADAYELLAGVLDKREDVALVYSNTYVSRVENEPFAENSGTEPFTTPAFFAPNQLLHFPFGAQPMWRRTVHDVIGVFDGTFKAAGDWDFAIRFVRKFRALHVEEVLGSYLVQDNAISFRDDTVKRENALIHGQIHNPDTAYVLYRQEGLALDTPQEQAQALVDLGVRALGYKIPYGTPKNKFPLALNFFAEATRLAPEWAVGWNNLAIALALTGQQQQAQEVIGALSAKAQHPTVERNARIIREAATGTPSEGLEVLPSGLPFPSQDELQASKVRPDRSVSAEQLLKGHAESRSASTGPAAAATNVQAAVNPVDRLRAEGIRLLQSGQIEQGVAKLDAAIEREPFDTKTHDVLRVLSLQVPEGWQQNRDQRVAQMIRSTAGEERLRWIHRAGQFLEAPETMETIWELVRSDLTPQPPDRSAEPRVTVVLTVHNHERYVEEAFRSVIAQTFRSWELVIVDDNSTDGTPALLERLVSEHKDYRITLLRLAGAGPARARNTGASHGTAPYLLLLDGDDLLAADSIDQLLPVLEQDANLGWAYPVSVQAGGHNRLWSWRPFNVAELAAADRMPVNSLIRRTMFENMGGFSPELVGAYEDWDLWLRAARAGWKAQMVPSALFLYRKVAGSRSDFNGQPEAAEVDAKRTMMRRVPDFYQPGAVDHPALTRVLRIPIELANRDYCTQLMNRFAANTPPDRPETRPKMLTVEPVGVTSNSTDTGQGVSAVAQPRPQADTGTNEGLESADEPRPQADTGTNGGMDTGTLSGGQEKKPVRVLFYFFKNVHIPVMLPVYHEMKRQGGFEIAFALYNFDRHIRAGMSSYEVEILRREGAPILNDPREWQADVTLMADNVAWNLFGCGKIVNIGHGLLSKGQYFTDTDMIHRENLEDLLCVPGPYHRQRIAEGGRVFVPVVATGFPKLDKLFDPEGPSREELLRRYKVDPSKRVVLFAPTFNMALSSIPILWMRVAELVDDDTVLMIKLHSSSLPEFKASYKELSEAVPNIIYSDDPDITNLLRVADVMVTDVSSVMMEFMALDKPVVLFDNPNQYTYRHYDPRDIEYAWRDVGIRASTLDEVKAAIRRSFANPGEFHEQRQRYGEQILADRQGGAAANVVTAIRNLLAGKFEPRKVLPDATTVLLPVRAGEEWDAAATVASVLEDGGENARVAVVDHGCDRAVLSGVLGERASEVKVMTPDAVRSDHFGTEHLALLQPGLDLGEKRLFRLVNHLRRSEQPAAVAPLLFPAVAQEVPQQNAANYVKGDTSVMADPLLLDRQMRFAGMATLHTKPIAAAKLVVASKDSAAWVSLLERAATGSVDPIPGVRLAFDVAVGRFADNRAQQPARKVSHGNGVAKPATPPRKNRMSLVTHYETRGQLDRALDHARQALAENAGDPEVQAAVERLEQAVSPA
ncbi:glycosyltransferase [bacterium]|nr:glycosyltransferase [bacterium]